MDFYEPTFLFRQNALRRASSPKKNNSTNPYLNENCSTSSLWLLNSDMTNDVSLTNRVCALDRVNIKSNYWKIPDSEMNLTALALSDPTQPIRLWLFRAPTRKVIFSFTSSILSSTT